VSQRALVEFRDRLRSKRGFRLRYLDPGSDEERTRDFELVEQPAGVWMGALFSDEAGDLLLDMLGEDDAAWLWELVEDPDEDLDESGLHRIGRQMLTRVADRPWWEAARLLATFVQERHTFDGLAADRGMPDPLTWPLPRLCNWVEYRLLSGQAKEADRNALEARLKAPPMDEDMLGEDPAWSDEEMAADWLEMAGTTPQQRA
jgi:hypothetical protein